MFSIWLLPNVELSQLTFHEVAENEVWEEEEEEEEDDDDDDEEGLT